MLPSPPASLTLYSIPKVLNVVPLTVRSLGLRLVSTPVALITLLALAPPLLPRIVGLLTPPRPLPRLLLSTCLTSVLPCRAETFPTPSDPVSVPSASKGNDLHPLSATLPPSHSPLTRPLASPGAPKTPDV